MVETLSTWWLEILVIAPIIIYFVLDFFGWS